MSISTLGFRFFFWFVCPKTSFGRIALFDFCKVQSRCSSRRSQLSGFNFRVSGFRFQVLYTNESRAHDLFVFAKVQSRSLACRSQLLGFNFRVSGFWACLQTIFGRIALFDFCKVQSRCSSRRSQLSGFNFRVSGFRFQVLYTNESRAHDLFVFAKVQSRSLACRSQLLGFNFRVSGFWACLQTIFGRMACLASPKFSRDLHLVDFDFQVSTFRFQVFLGLPENQFRAYGLF